MFLNSTNNCCAAGLLGGFGNSHGGSTHYTFEAFAECLFKGTLRWTQFSSSAYKVYYGFLNSYQRNELRWLEQIGFEKKTIEGLIVVTIGGQALLKYFHTLYAKELEEEKQKRKELAEKVARDKEEARLRRVAEREKLKENGAYRKPGEFRVGDKVYRYFADGVVRHGWENGPVSRRGVVELVGIDGSITIVNGRGRSVPFFPVVAKGANAPRNIQRKAPSTLW